MKTSRSKPLFAVPSMAEICKVKPNGYSVISTFSGCGGSCLGYRMAGYKVIWANEFVPAAQDSYRANMAKDCILDGHDIRTVQVADILKATGLKPGELDLFDGSPPCQSFSTAGKREKGWGKLKTYEHGAKQLNENLFDEYIRLLRGLQPRVFVAENVSGLVKGTAKGYFLDILAEMKSTGYNVKAKLLDAQWLGVPQRRQRIIFIGVRNDLNLAPAFPEPLSYRYSVREALPWIVGIGKVPGGDYDKKGNGRDWGNAETPVGSINATGQRIPLAKAIIIHPSGFGKGQNDSVDLPMPVVMARPEGIGGMGPGQTLLQLEDSRPSRPVTGDDSFGSRGIVKRKFTIVELKRICAFPDDFILTGSYRQQWERLGNSVPPVMMYYIAATVSRDILDKLPLPDA